MEKKYRKSILGHVIFRILGWCFLLLILTLIIASCRSEHVRELQYKAELNEYEAELQEYNATIADYKQELRNYYGEVAETFNIPSSGKLLIDVSISTTKTNNEKIGNEISYKYEINDQTVSDGGQAYIYLFSQNKIFSEIRDDDPSSDDVGNASDELNFSLSQLNNGVSVTQNISVHENYGRDAGKTATYRVVYNLKLHDTINMQGKTIGNEPTYPQITEPVKPEQSNVKVKWYFVLANDWFTKISIIAAACFFSFFAIRKTASEVAENKRKLKEELQAKVVYEKERQNFLEELQGKSLLELAKVPRNISFNDDGLPVDTSSSGKYGCFSAYYTYGGKCFHLKRGCSSAFSEIHLFSAIKRGYRPCSKCIKEKPVIPQWYIDYQELQRKKKYFKI